MYEHICRFAIVFKTIGNVDRRLTKDCDVLEFKKTMRSANFILYKLCENSLQLLALWRCQQSLESGLVFLNRSHFYINIFDGPERAVDNQKIQLLHTRLSMRVMCFANPYERILPDKVCTLCFLVCQDEIEWLAPYGDIACASTNVQRFFNCIKQDSKRWRLFMCLPCFSCASRIPSAPLRPLPRLF